MVSPLHCHEHKKPTIPGQDTHDKPINIPNPVPKNPGYDESDGDKRRSPDPTEKRSAKPNIG